MEASDVEVALRELALGGADAAVGERSGFGTWGRVTPAWVLILALRAMLLRRWRREGYALLRELAAGLDVAELSEEQALAVVRPVIGELSAVRIASAGGRLAPDDVVVLLRAVIHDEGLSEAAVVELLSQARVEADDVLAAGAWRRPRIRGVETGPWDVREAAEAGAVSAADRIDLGGLRLPVGAGGLSVEFAPVRDAGLDIVGVRAESGATTLELQALHTQSGLCWDEARESAVTWLRHQGARVGGWLGPAGSAVRGWLPPERKSRWAVGSPRPVGVFGCDGPGWVLRALLTGEGAAPEGDGSAAWAYELFAGTVVNASGSGSTSLATPGTPIALRWPW